MKTRRAPGGGHWIVDGYNCIRQVPELRAQEARGLRAGREALTGLLGRFASSGRRVTVVFDGPAGVLPFYPADGRVRVIFSAGVSADEVIREQVERAARPAGITVVSADREVAFFARRCGCRVQAPEEFLAAAGRQAPPAAEGEFHRRVERELRRVLRLR